MILDLVIETTQESYNTINVGNWGIWISKGRDTHNNFGVATGD